MTAIQYISQLPSAATPARTDLVPVTQGSTGALSGTTRKLLMSAFADGLPVLATGSTTSRTLATRFADVANVKDYGAVGDGVTNDTTAIQAAIASVASGGRVVFPAGVYLVSPMTIANLSNVTLEGDNKNISILRLAAPGTLLALQNAQWCLVTRLGFQTNATPQVMANATGLQFDTAAGNNTVDDCTFLGFSLGGLKIVGTVATQLSGHKVTNCYFLGNGQYQFHGVYCNDFHIENNQFGRLGGIALAAIGAFLDNSSAGTYLGNYHWDNTLGFKASTCNYNTYTGNRFEESSQSNVVLDSGSYNIFSNNKCHTASKGASGTYDNVVIQNVSVLSVLGNTVFSWNATTSRWGLNFVLNCSNVTLGKNKIDGFSPSYGPIGVGGSVGVIAADFELRGITQSPSAANNVSYVGPQINTFFEGQAMFNITRRCTLLRIWASVDAVPGAGQSFSYVARKNSVDTSMTAVISGAASFSAATNATTPAVLFAPDDGASLKLTTSAAAAAANHRWYAVLAEY